MHILALTLLLTACNHGEGSDDTGLDAICRPGTSWSPGTTAFADATEDWGLDSFADTMGVRITAVDHDGDGWADLFVRRGSSPDDFSEGGTRTSFLLRNTGAGSFEDVTEASGIRQGRAGSRGYELVAWGDFDSDGDLDLYTGENDPEGNTAETSELLINNGDGTFSLGPEDSAVRLEADYPMGASWADVDLDGDLDLWVTQFYEQDALYLNDGAGKLTDKSKSAGLLTKAWRYLDDLNAAECHTAAWSAAACDLDNDGYPELLSASYGRAPNHLWLNQGDRTFTNRSVESGYAFDHRVDWTDNESARCWCKLHPEDEGCDLVTEEPNITCYSDSDAFRWDHTYDREPFRLGGNSGTTVCADVDNDGWIDLLTTEIVHWDVGTSSDPSELLFNTQDTEVVFERPGNEATGLVREHSETAWNDGDMTGALFDFDNDGWLDVYVGDSDYPGSRARFWHQTSPRQFEVVPDDEGIDHTRAHGTAVADFDRDGDLDIVVGHSSARCDDDCYETFNVRFFENQTAPDQTNWVQLRLVGGEGSNRAAIGARIAVTAGGITQTRVVGGGHGQVGYQHDLVQHLGLGDSCEAEVQITWPNADRTTQSFTVGGGYRYEVVQGSDPVGLP